MSGESADLSTICELEWDDWVKIRDTSQIFPKNKGISGLRSLEDLNIRPSLSFSDEQSVVLSLFSAFFFTHYCPNGQSVITSYIKSNANLPS